MRLNTTYIIMFRGELGSHGSLFSSAPLWREKQITGACFVSVKVVTVPSEACSTALRLGANTVSK